MIEVYIHIFFVDLMQKNYFKILNPPRITIISEESICITFPKYLFTDF